MDLSQPILVAKVILVPIPRSIFSSFQAEVLATYFYIRDMLWEKHEHAKIYMFAVRGECQYYIKSPAAKNKITLKWVAENKGNGGIERADEIVSKRS